MALENPASSLDIAHAGASIAAAALGQRTMADTRTALLEAMLEAGGCARAAMLMAPPGPDGDWSLHCLDRSGRVVRTDAVPSPATLFGPGEPGPDGWVGAVWGLGSIWPSSDADAPVAAWPIMVDEEMLAVLVGEWQSGSADANTEVGRSMAEQAGPALDAAIRFEELEQLGTGALRAMARMVDAGSPWTMGRSERVTLWALEIARRMGVSQRELRRLEIGGLVHDIGRLSIPIAILDKVGPLTTEERDLIRSHPDLGVQRLGAIPAFSSVLPMVRHHHELLDGSGYPLGLEGDAIPLLVRILTLADVHDAMRSDRAYRTGLGVEEIVKVLRSGSGTRFDQDGVTVLLQMIEEGWEPSK